MLVFRIRVRLLNTASNADDQFWTELIEPRSFPRNTIRDLYHSVKVISLVVELFIVRALM